MIDIGYTTDFYGSVQIVPPLNDHEIGFLEDFRSSRRMNRTKGPLFVKGDGGFGQGHDEDILDYNSPHPDQPGLWCQWFSEGGADIEWDGGEKFYNAAEWMEYLVTNLFAPSARGYIADHIDEDERLRYFTCDHVINGEIEAQGEDHGDRWTLVVRNNQVRVGDTVVVPSATVPLVDAVQEVKTFDDIATEQGWNLDSQISVIRGFIDQHGLEPALAESAAQVAKEENA